MIHMNHDHVTVDHNAQVPNKQQIRRILACKGRYGLYYSFLLGKYAIFQTSLHRTIQCSQDRIRSYYPNIRINKEQKW